MGPTTPPLKENLVTETKTREQNICGDGGEAHQETGLMRGDSQTRQGAGTPMVDSLKPNREGTGVDLGIPGKMCDRQTTVANPGDGLMRKPARRGLSK